MVQGLSPGIIVRNMIAKSTIHVLPQIGTPAIPDQLYDIQVLLTDGVSDHEMHARDDTLVHDDHSLVILILFFKQCSCIFIQLLQGATRARKINVH